MLGAITILRDARAGAELGKMDRGAAAVAGQGIWTLADQAFSDLDDRVIDVYSGQVSDWLKAS